MKHYIIAALVAGSALAACGGGSATPPPFNTGTFVPTPSPSPTPRVVTAHLSWVGAAHSSSSSASALSRLPLAAGSPEPIEIGVDPGNANSIPSTSVMTVASLLVTFTDQNGNVVAPPTGAPTVTVADSTLASSSPQPAPSASPSAGPVNVAQINAGTSLGATSTTVTYPNGASSTIAVRVYADPSLECPAGRHPGSVEGIRIAGGAFPTATSATADFYLTGPLCADKSTAASTLHAPLGFQSYSSATPIASITSALPFTPTANAIAISDLVSAVQVGNDWVFVVKGASGDYGKMRIATVGCGGGALCEISALVGTVAAYGPGGAFSL